MKCWRWPLASTSAYQWGTLPSEPASSTESSSDPWHNQKWRLVKQERDSIGSSLFSVGCECFSLLFSQTHKRRVPRIVQGLELALPLLGFLDICLWKLGLRIQALRRRAVLCTPREEPRSTFFTCVLNYQSLHPLYFTTHKSISSVNIFSLFATLLLNMLHLEMLWEKQNYECLSFLSPSESLIRFEKKTYICKIARNAILAIWIAKAVTSAASTPTFKASNAPEWWVRLPVAATEMRTWTILGPR